MRSFITFILFVLFQKDVVVSGSTCYLGDESKPDKIPIGDKTSFRLSLSGLRHQNSNLSVCVIIDSEKHAVATTLSNVTLTTNKNYADVDVYGQGAGETFVIFNTSSSINISNLHSFKVKVHVVHSNALVILNMVIGWIYFVAWSISFYPQVYVNWSRKSVIGLNFDFVCYNLLGFIAYGVFNVGMFWIPEIKSEYVAKHPNEDEDPVELNDVFFTLHAILLTIITGIQILIYERGDQVVSMLCKILISVSCVFVFIALMVTIFTDKISWLQYLYYFSYVKIGVTLIKYVPQAYMNFRRKSTVGWSIGNVLLDFTGGSLSILQMIILSYNNDSWEAIFGDLTKFGLGLISIIFDVLFMTQHYLLYPQKKQRDYECIQDYEDEVHGKNGKIAAPT